MSAVIMSDIAFNEFKDFLKEQNVDVDTLRIFFAGMGCSGPAFNIAVDDKKDSDVEVKINDLTFILEQSLKSWFVL